VFAERIVLEIMTDQVAATSRLEAPGVRRLRQLMGAAGVCLLAIAVGASPTIAARAKQRAHASIVGGSRTSIEDLPFQVAVYDPQIIPGPGEAANPVQSQFCAGVILDATHVITAGHCVMNQQPRGVATPQQLEVLAGTNDLNTADGQPPDYIEDPVAVTSFNPAWDLGEGSHDIGLLMLQNPLWTGAAPAIDGVNKVAPIALAEEVPAPGSTLTVSGWGYDKELIGETRPSEEVGFERYLQSVSVPLVAQAECVKDYESIAQTIAPSTVCAGSAGHGPCYSDSGGPLFEGPSTPPGSYRLVGTVDFGNGCAEAGFPGVYQSLIDPGNLDFIRSDPPQAPLEQSAPGISGTPLPGHTLTCSPGSWSDSPSYSYRFYVDEASASDPEAHSAITPALSAQATYVVSTENVGQKIYCLARATNAGGYDFDISPDVSVAGAAIQSSPLALPAPPTLKLVSRSCVKMRCVVNVRASAGTGAAAVATIQATLSFKRWGTCRRRLTHLKCLHTLTLKPRVEDIPDDHFVVLTGLLQAGKYRLTLVAIDKARVRQVKATEVTLTVKQARRRR